MICTPENLAVVGISSWVEKPETVDLFIKSAERLNIPLILFEDSSFELKTHISHISFTLKVLHFRENLKKLDARYKYILYVDVRDVLFISPLDQICRTFNRIGWPVVISSSQNNAPHIDPGWADRFPKHPPHGFNYINAGCWIGEREAVMRALDGLEFIHGQIMADKVPSSVPHCANSDQHCWQAAFLEQTFPIRVDFNNDIFVTINLKQVALEWFDWSGLGTDSPATFITGSKPCILHFPSTGSVQRMKSVASIIFSQK